MPYTVKSINNNSWIIEKDFDKKSRKFPFNISNNATSYTKSNDEYPASYFCATVQNKEKEKHEKVMIFVCIETSSYCMY